jgi:hypothetical protein
VSCLYLSLFHYDSAQQLQNLRPFVGLIYQPFTKWAFLASFLSFFRFCFWQANFYSSLHEIIYQFLQKKPPKSTPLNQIFTELNTQTRSYENPEPATRIYDFYYTQNCYCVDKEKYVFHYNIRSILMREVFLITNNVACSDVVQSSFWYLRGFLRFGLINSIRTELNDSTIYHGLLVWTTQCKA